MSTVEITEGDKCPFAGCDGILGFNPTVNCSCHIDAPCHQCVNNPLTCLTCGWLDGDPFQ